MPTIGKKNILGFMIWSSGVITGLAALLLSSNFCYERYKRPANVDVVIRAWRGGRCVVATRSFEILTIQIIGYWPQEQPLFRKSMSPAQLQNGEYGPLVFIDSTTAYTRNFLVFSVVTGKAQVCSDGAGNAPWRERPVIVSPPTSCCEITFSIYMLTSIAAFIFIGSGIMLRRRLRSILAARANHFGGCAACGYDLRGSPGRCPECGKVSGGSATGSGISGREPISRQIPS